MGKLIEIAETEMIEAIEKAQGFVSKAAEILGISRMTFYRILGEYRTAQESLQDVREKRHDYVELKLMEGIRAGDKALIIFYLKTQAKDRGYVTRQEITGKDGKDIPTIKVIEIVKAGVTIEK